MIGCMPGDQLLLQQIQAHDGGAFDVFYARHRDAVTRLLSRILRDPVMTEDSTQETFLRVWSHAEQWDERGSVKSWLLRIATNLALNQLRTVKRRREVPFEAPSFSEDDESQTPGWMIDTAGMGPEAFCLQSERQQLYRQLVDGLSEEKREVFRLVHEAEMEINEVAERLGIPEGTVKSRLHYARKTLARKWQSWEEE